MRRALKLELKRRRPPFSARDRTLTPLKRAHPLRDTLLSGLKGREVSSTVSSGVLIGKLEIARRIPRVSPFALESEAFRSQTWQRESSARGIRQGGAEIDGHIAVCVCVGSN